MHSAATVTNVKFVGQLIAARLHGLIDNLQLAPDLPNEQGDTVHHVAQGIIAGPAGLLPALFRPSENSRSFGNLSEQGQELAKSIIDRFPRAAGSGHLAGQP